MERVSVEKERVHKNIYFVAIVIVVFFRIAIVSRLLPNVCADTPHDDLWLVERADSILGGKWLGEYSQYTMLKGVFAPLFLAFSNFVGMNYMDMCTLVYILSCLVFLVTISKYIPKEKYWLKLLIFIIILYNPISYAEQTWQKVYRNGMSQWELLLLFASVIAIVYERNNGWKKIILWSILEGMALWAYNNTREDGLWTLIFASCSSLSIYLIQALSSKKFAQTKYLILLIPFIILLCGNITIKTINLAHYGIFAQNDRTQGKFADVMKDIYLIKAGDNTYAEENGIYINVYHEALNKAYDVSPTLYALKPELESSLQAWDIIDSVVGDGEIEGDHLLFAVRDAVKNAGYYMNGKETEAFYNQIHNELKMGFKEGLLEKRGIAITSNSVPLQISKLPTIFGEIKSVLRTITTFENVGCSVAYARGSDEHIDLFESITGNYGIRNTTDGMEISGWIFCTDDLIENIRYVWCDEQGNEIQDVEFFEGTDVYDYFCSIGNGYETARKCRFNTKLSGCPSGVFLNVYIDSELEYQIWITSEGNVVMKESEQILCNIDYVYVSCQQYDHLLKNTGKANKVINIYQYFGRILWWISIMVYISLWTLYITKKDQRKYGIQLLVSTGIILSLILFMFCIAYIQVTTFYARHYLYLSSGYILYLMFCVYMIVVLFTDLVPKINTKCRV